MLAKPNFALIIEDARQSFLSSSYEVQGAMWQSIDVSSKPEMMTRELLNYSFQVPVSTDVLQVHREDIQPNLPWADDHFGERVGGKPLNPGVQWAKWPWSHSADRFRDSTGRFSHTYMERYWPKFANTVRDEDMDQDMSLDYAHRGIRYYYGDLRSVVDHMIRDPLTRQAYLPVWFPEDTGVEHGERVPCSLGYHFIMRMGYLHMVYYLRSCEFVRHFRDDIYLSVRLQLWMIDQLKARGGEVFEGLKPGMFTMHITSFHIFLNDFRQLKS